MSDQLLYNIPEAAERLGLGRTSMYGLIDSGEVATVRIGRRRLVPATALEEFVEKLTASTGAA